MSDYFHEQMVNKMLEPKERDFPCKECWVLAMEEKRVSQYIAEDKAQRMLLRNAEIVNALEDVRAEIDLRSKSFADAVEESTYAPTRDTYMDKANECHEIIKIIDRKIKEIENDR